MRRRLRAQAHPDWGLPGRVRFREYGSDAAEGFQRIGLDANRPFVAHRAYHLPCAGPRSGYLSRALCGIRSTESLWEVLLTARGPVLDEFPNDLFFDDELIWHRQHFGQPGHLAYACLAFRGDTMYALAYVSDLVQRISRRRDHETRIESRFRAWPQLLLNSVMHFAIERGARRVLSPTSATVLSHTDLQMKPRRELLEPIYDGAVTEQFSASRKGGWWVLDVEENRRAVIHPTVSEEPRGVERTICVCHDIERDLGHRVTDPAFADAIRPRAAGLLSEMLGVERTAGVRATYAVVGELLPQVRHEIAADGHCLAFHSFDHKLHALQLERCRKMDPRIAGYRPPQSQLTFELRDRSLCRHDFRWIAVEAGRLGLTSPALERRVVKIPIHLDDYSLHRRQMTYPAWEEQLIELARRHSFLAFSLHDCYADHWLPHYPRLLAKLAELGKLRTLDEVAWRVSLAHAV